MVDQAHHDWRHLRGHPVGLAEVQPPANRPRAPFFDNIGVAWIPALPASSLVDVLVGVGAGTVILWWIWA